MRTVSLTNSELKAFVDDEDFEMVTNHYWRAEPHYGGRWYATTSIWDHNRKRTLHVRMHQFLTCSTRKRQCDHEDGNGLNNVRSNLRIATHRQNIWNSRKVRTATSKFKWVSRAKGGLWQVKIMAHGKNHWGGLFRDEIEAAKAANALARRLHGEFAKLNIIPPSQP